MLEVESVVQRAPVSSHCRFVSFLENSEIKPHLLTKEIKYRTLTSFGLEACDNVAKNTFFLLVYHLCVQHVLCLSASRGRSHSSPYEGPEIKFPPTLEGQIYTIQILKI